MTTSTTITFRAEPSVKKAAQKRAEEIDISLSTVLNSALRNFARGERVIIDETFYVEDSGLSRSYVKEKLKEAEKEVSKECFEWRANREVLGRLRKKHGI